MNGRWNDCFQLFRIVVENSGISTARQRGRYSRSLPYLGLGAASTERHIFQAFVDQVLCSRLRPAHVVVVDNLSAHKTSAVRDRIEAVCALLLARSETRLKVLIQDQGDPLH